MDIQILREFITLMTYRSGAEAARVLNVDPSTLSRHMHALERELDVRLLEPGKRTEFTPEAHAIAPTIVEALNGIDAIGEAVRRAKSAKARPFRVYCMPYDPLCEELLAMAIEAMRDQRDVTVVEVNTIKDSVYEDLAGGVVDAAFGPPYGRAGGKDIEHWEILQDQLAVWFDKDSDLAKAVEGADEIPIAALSGCVLPVAIDQQMRLASETRTDALLSAGVGIRLEPIVADTVRDYYAQVRGNRFFVVGDQMPPTIPRAICDRMSHAKIRLEDANANRVLTVRAGEKGVAALRLRAALLDAASKFDA